MPPAPRLFDINQPFVVSSFSQLAKKEPVSKMPSHSSDDASRAGRSSRGWIVAAAFLVAIIIAGSAFIGTRYGRERGLEITIEPEKNVSGYISVSGEVNNPGLYPLRDGDTIDDVLKAAGGTTASADPARLELEVYGQGEDGTPQKVDINRAEAWLLAALPGIGETRARAIIDYRGQHGPFRDINELLKVPGIGDTTLEGIRPLITVSE
jgi:competence protein ComEA